VVRETILGKKISKPVVRQPGFSPRELEVLNLLGKGLSRHEIAEQLSISEKTVSTYQAILMEKLKADNVNGIDPLCYRRRTSRLRHRVLTSRVALPRLVPIRTNCSIYCCVIGFWRLLKDFLACP